MGHRSWFYEIKSKKDLENSIDFIKNAMEITGYSCCARAEVFFKLDDKLYLGWASDGSSAGQVFELVVKKKDHHFGLLGDDSDERIHPRYLQKNKCYLSTEQALQHLGLTDEPVEKWQNILENAASEDAKTDA